MDIYKPPPMWVLQTQPRSSTGTSALNHGAASSAPGIFTTLKSMHHMKVSMLGMHLMLIVK